MLRRCAVVRLHLRRCAAAPLRCCLVALAPLHCCAAAPLFGCSCAGALLRRCAVVRFHLRRCAAAPLRRCVVAVAPVRCCAVAVPSGCSCAWFCACIPGCATGCYLRTVGLLGSDTCNCVFFTLALPVASIGGLMIFHNILLVIYCMGFVGRRFKQCELLKSAFFFGTTPCSPHPSKWKTHPPLLF